MREIISISNQKGGVGKSTTTNALGAYLHRKGFRVLYIDLDPQRNLTYSILQQDPNRYTGTALEFLKWTADPEKIIQTTPQGDIIPGNGQLASLEHSIHPENKEYRLKSAISELIMKRDYDYILLDTPPALSILTTNALTACHSVIIPATADIFSLQGIADFLKTFKLIQQERNHNLRIRGILITRYTQRTNLAKAVSEMLQGTANAIRFPVYQTKIRECNAIKEAQARQKDIFSYNLKSNATADYEAFGKEFLNQTLN